jgi:hypothetical protein
MEADALQVLQAYLVIGGKRYVLVVRPIASWLSVIYLQSVEQMVAVSRAESNFASFKPRCR